MECIDWWMVDTGRLSVSQSHRMNDKNESLACFIIYLFEPYTHPHTQMLLIVLRIASWNRNGYWVEFVHKFTQRSVHTHIHSIHISLILLLSFMNTMAKAVHHKLFQTLLTFSFYYLWHFFDNSFRCPGSGMWYVCYDHVPGVNSFSTFYALHQTYSFASMIEILRMKHTDATTNCQLPSPIPTVERADITCTFFLLFLTHAICFFFRFSIHLHSPYI